MATDRVRLCSVTLCQHSDGREVASLRTAAGVVDRLVLLDTHEQPWDFPEAKAEFGDLLQVVHFGPITAETPSCDYRNRSLAIAAELGFNWALILDSDEFLEIAPGVDLLGQLAQTTADAISLDARGDSYAKEKIFRLPAKGRWVLPAHEVYEAPSGTIAVIPGVGFSEKPKSAEELRERRNVIRRLLWAYTLRTDNPPAIARAWQMLGQEMLGELQGVSDPEAQQSILGSAELDFRAALQSQPSKLGESWTRYLLATCLLASGEYVEAREVANRGMLVTPWMPELHYAMAKAWLAEGDAYNAIACANCAAALGNYRGSGKSIARVSHYDSEALWEGPFDVMADALRLAGEYQAAEAIDRLAAEAEAARS